MSTTGKKGKKAKAKTVSLNDFLNKGNSNGGPDTTTVVVPSTRWADESIEDDRRYGNKPEAFVLPTAPRAARGSEVSDERVPKDPPFTAFITNLSYDVDTEAVTSFFSKLKLKGVRLPRDGDPETGRLKGFGYADFDDRESLVEALTMNDQLLCNRKIRVDLATQAGRGTERSSYNDRGGSRYGDREPADDRTTGNWRSGPTPPARDNDRGSDRGSGYDRDGNRGYGFGREQRDNRSYTGEGYRSNGFKDDRGYDRKESGGFDRYDRRDDRSKTSPELPKERPRLNLLPKQTDRVANSEETATIRNASIFGSAKPIDTATKEADVDQKLQERQTRVPTTDIASKQSNEEEKVNSSEKEKDEQSKENGDMPKAEKPSIFGGAKPVDTSAREKEIEEKQKKQNVGKVPMTTLRDRNGIQHSGTTTNRETASRSNVTSSINDECKENRNQLESRKPASSSIFGSAKPVDTQAREKEIEERTKNSRLDIGKEEGRVSERDVRKYGDRTGMLHDSGEERKKYGNQGGRQDKTPPPMKKIEETKELNFVGSNKFQFLQDDEVGNGNDSE